MPPPVLPVKVSPVTVSGPLQLLWLTAPPVLPAC
jgi:hypothetical protein